MDKGTVAIALAGGALGLSLYNYVRGKAPSTKPEDVRPVAAPAASGGADGLVAGARVEAKFGGKGKFYPGKIEAVNADGTFAILFDDGGKEASAIPENVVPVVSERFDDGKFDEERKKAIEAILRDKPSA